MANVSKKCEKCGGRFPSEKCACRGACLCALNREARRLRTSPTSREQWRDCVCVPGEAK